MPERRKNCAIKGEEKGFKTMYGRYLRRVCPLLGDRKTRNGRKFVVHAWCTCECTWPVMQLMMRYNNGAEREKQRKK